MKASHLAAVLVLGLFLGGCGAQKAALEAETAAIVAEAIETQAFTMNVNQSIPVRGTPRNDFGYSITVKDGVLDSHLPYFGMSRVVAYNIGNSLSFTSPVQAYNCYQNKKGAFIIEFVATNSLDPKTPVYYQLTVWDNGSAHLIVNSPGRDTMTYNGSLRKAE